MLSDAELDRLAREPQHEGLYVEARPRAWCTLEAIAEDLARTHGICIALDRVKNPYNVGAIVRSAAFFGARSVVLGTPAAQENRLETHAVRVAEGGAEHLLFAHTTRLGDALAILKAKGARIAGADGSATRDARALGAQGPKSIVLVFGNERTGLHDRVRAECDELVAIFGSNNVDSLNVAVAAGILISIAAQNRTGIGTSRSRNVPSPT